MQQLTKAKCKVVENAILMVSLVPPELEAASQWTRDVLSALELRYVESEVSADLYVVAAKFEIDDTEEMLFMKINYTIDDIWFELAQHNEKKFFKLFDHIESRLMSIQ